MTEEEAQKAGIDTKTVDDDINKVLKILAGKTNMHNAMLLAGCLEIGVKYQSENFLEMTLGIFEQLMTGKIKSDHKVIQ